MLAALVMGTSLSAQQDVLTGGYDNARTNANLHEPTLTPANVGPNSFGKLFSLSVDGQIYAQPLFEQNVSIAGQGVHSVVFTATMHNTVYAFDANWPAIPLWSMNLGPSIPSSAFGDAFVDIRPEIGILSTPVIDPATHTLYVVAGTFENDICYYRLHALDTGTGSERAGSPVTIGGNGALPGALSFEAVQHLQRPALLLANGNIYIAFGSHADWSPYHGWVMAFSAANVQTQTGVFNVTPHGDGGAIWQSGRGLNADEQGNVYAVTSNGDTDDGPDYSSSVVRLDPNQLSVSDWFAPVEFQALNVTDTDLGSAGAMLIPGTNLLVTIGKEGQLFLLDRTSLGHLVSVDTQAPQAFFATSIGVFNMALWSRSAGATLYLPTLDALAGSWKLTAGQFDPNKTSQTTVPNGIPYEGMTISANGGNDGSGILWETAPIGSHLPGNGALYAFNASDLSKELWDSTMNDGDQLGRFAKFANPTVANGRVYVPTGSNALVVYGQIGFGGGQDAPPPAITGITNAASYAGNSLAPGEITAIFGQDMGPDTLTVGTVGAGGQLSPFLSGTQVFFNGVAAPVIYTIAGVIGTIVPFEVAGAATVDVRVMYNGQISNAQTVPLSKTIPGIFALNVTGSGPGAILNQDYSVNSPANAAAAGSIVIVYATGGGQTDPPTPTGHVVSLASPLTATPVTATIGGVQAKVLYAGGAPTLLAGVLQVNVQLPAGVTGTVPVVLTISGQMSQQTVTVSVK